MVVFLFGRVLLSAVNPFFEEGALSVAHPTQPPVMPPRYYLLILGLVSPDVEIKYGLGLLRQHRVAQACTCIFPLTSDASANRMGSIKMSIFLRVDPPEQISGVLESAEFCYTL